MRAGRTARLHHWKVEHRTAGQQTVPAKRAGSPLRSDRIFGPSDFRPLDLQTSDLWTFRLFYYLCHRYRRWTDLCWLQPRKKML